MLLEVELQWGHRCGRCRDLCWARSGVWSSGGSSERLAVQVICVGGQELRSSVLVIRRLGVRVGVWLDLFLWLCVVVATGVRASGGVGVYALSPSQERGGSACEEVFLRALCRE